KGDLDLLERFSDRLAIFSPTVEEMYAGNVRAESYDFDGLDQVMEGAFRSGHFDGVGTVVERLLRTVDPHRAYFGEKDFQQLQIIRKMVELKGLPHTIIGCPIAREANGLAMSSRNERLDPATKEEAGVIHASLQLAKAKFGMESVQYIKERVRQAIGEHPGFVLEYFEMADEADLLPLDTIVQ